MPPTSPTARPGPERLETRRLLLRRARDTDADAIFSRYASDPAVTHLVGWPMHRSLEDTRAFLSFDAGQWASQLWASYLIFSRESGELLGATGLQFETPTRASTGYVLSKDAWGRGFATEALSAMVDLARETGVRRLYALCHHEHAASAHVLEKCNFAREGVLRAYAPFPNLAAREPQDVLCYAILL